MVIPEEKRHTRDYGWLKTSWLFSFNDYHDPNNLSFGNLRAFNDDLIQPGKGFSDHRHNEMEIVTFVLEGELSHRDSAGNEGTIRANEAQRLSAGTGVIHSEFNRGPSPVHLYQMWFFPSRRGLLPSYAKGDFHQDGRQDRLQAIASGEGIGGMDMAADATIYACNLGEGKMVQIGGKERMLFIYLTSGVIDLERREVGQNDQVRMIGEANIRAEEDAKFIVIDMPKMKW